MVSLQLDTDEIDREIENQEAVVLKMTKACAQTKPELESGLIGVDE